MPTTIARCLLAAVILAGGAFAENVEVDLVERQVIQQRLENVALKSAERQAAVRRLLEEAGCAVEEQPVSKKTANVICVLPGQTDSIIMVGAHFDHAPMSGGVVDNWSGASLLASLYLALSKVPRKHTFVFAAFAEEEKGLIGSSKYVKALPKEKAALIRAYINLDCLGLGPVKVWARRSNPVLIDRLGEVASALGLRLAGLNVDGVGDDDSRSFFKAGIPVLSLHSLTPNALPFLHTMYDRVEAIRFDDYYETYRLVAYYLGYLDVKTN